MICTIKQTVHKPGKTTYQSKFYKDFHKGYSSAGDIRLLDLHIVKKLPELYLYAQGVLFYRYENTLESFIFTTGDAASCNDESELHCEHLRSKMEMLKNTGIIDYLKEKFTSASSEDINRDVADTLCSLIDESNQQKSYVLSQL